MIAEQSKAYQAKDKAKMKALEDSDEGKEMATEQKNFFDTVESSYGKLYSDNKDSWWGPFAMLVP